MNFYSASFILIFLLCFYLYRKLNSPPKYAKKLPIISFLKTVIAALSNKTVDYRFKNIEWPKLKEKGYAFMYSPIGWAVLVSKPEFAKMMFRDSNKFIKPLLQMEGSLGLLFTGSRNIVSETGENWKRLRRPVNPIFSQTFQPGIFAPSVTEFLEVLDKRVVEHRGRPIEVHDLISLTALQILGHGILSVDLEAIKTLGNSNYYRLYKDIINFLINPLFALFIPLHRLPFGPPMRTRKKIEEFNNFILGIIIQRRQDLSDGKFLDSKDILSTMLRHDPDSPYEPLTDEELVHNINVFFFAGHDTTANTLTYALYYLARNQDIQQKLRNEIYREMDLELDNKTINTPTLDQLKRMEYLNLVIKETMRIAPAALQIGRKLAEDLPLPEEGIVIPHDTIMLLNIYSILHDPAIYANPDEFNPERFLNGKYDTDVYSPFGGGSRICVGMGFSLMEQKVFLSLLLQKFELKIAKDNPDYEKLRLTGLGLTRAKDLKLNFTARI